jgi:phosphate transport system permease protein
MRRDINRGDRRFRLASATIASISIVLLFAIGWQLTSAAWPAIQNFGAGFLVGREWDPIREWFGALPFLWGTVISSFLALLIAVPVALGAAIFLAELAPPWLARPVGFLIELLAAVPSVVFGLWGIFVLVPWMRDTVQPAIEGLFAFEAAHKTGVSLLTAGLILAIMILPTIASVAREVLRVTPVALREGALALGATRWEAVRVGVLPVARSGLIGAIVLGLSRALGETMAVTMVIGNRSEVATSIFAPSNTLASAIANEYPEAQGLHLAALAELGLVLFLLTFVMNFGARLLVRKTAGAK